MICVLSIQINNECPRNIAFCHKIFFNVNLEYQIFLRKNLKNY